ncbi:C2 calcium-dependent domain-containing protein 4C [Sphaeramia orbicularis]|uniref:C2 calcium-dependent domain-containing protein 4C-like n=1 Tax=Sphaeramia orbicularis TaxID=375764 RepID=A0A673CPR2_9TELE|nr:C2 calcium-dependent domain-containing protein 4C-like [Sphaeramia orbicularis]
MWVLEKIRESMENIPHYMEKNGEDHFGSSTSSTSYSLHSNIITPDKIPEFCLPPRLCKRSPLQGNETTPTFLSSQNWTQQSNTHRTTDIMQEKMKDRKAKNQDPVVDWKAVKKPLPFSAAGYGLAGIYESPNTRRKESLFHAKCPAYVFDRRTPIATPRPANETNLPKKHSPLSGFFPRFSHKSLSETESTESETPSSSDSSPLSSPYSSKSSLNPPCGTGRLKGATSCPSLFGSLQENSREKRGPSRLSSSTSNPQSLQESSLTLSPPITSPLDILQCQERLQREHVLPLEGRGKVRLSAERTTFSTNSLYTIRVRVVSVEGLQEETDRRTLNCAVSVCLMPGKVQQQVSATIRNCRSPVFNEDFFFTELSQENLLELKLRLKVLDKPAAGSLRRGMAVGVITKPLSHLLPLKKY